MAAMPNANLCVSSLGIAELLLSSDVAERAGVRPAYHFRPAPAAKAKVAIKTA